MDCSNHNHHQDTLYYYHHLNPYLILSIYILLQPVVEYVPLHGDLYN